ncbi:MAG: hypothetical protein LAP87_06775 [Acidobacteriia bacterium]|nr:hypothetical protein [Terriglobia bacterium]
MPQPAVVAIDEEFLRSNPEVCLSLGNEQIAVRPGVHYGSQYAVSCVGSPIYDFLPDSMLSEVFNRNHFLGALVADKWLANGDGRQAVFYRARIMGLSPAPSPVRWVAQMIDHGHAFQGSGWTFRDSPIQGLHARRVVYGSDPSIRDFAPWIDALMRVSRDFLDKVFLLIPPDWIAGEELEFLRVLRRLYQRRERVPQLLAESIDHLTKSNLAQPRESRCSS